MLTQIRYIGGPRFGRMSAKIATYCLTTYDIQENTKYSYLFKSKTILASVFTNLAKQLNIAIPEHSPGQLDKKKMTNLSSAKYRKGVQK